jgi:hypothetical protein
MNNNARCSPLADLVLVWNLEYSL